MELKDSIDDVRRRDRNKYVLIRFEVDKNKADNLLLQRRIGTQRLIIGTVVLASVLLILGLVSRARAKRRRLKQESENAIRESQLKTSQKVHDVVANGLYRIMNELEHQETAVAKDSLLNKIEQLYEKSRDISYERVVAEPADGQQISQVINSFASDQTKVIILGTAKAFWDILSRYQKHELELILEELMVNMKKHSQARKVIFQFRQEEDTGYIDYKDDGSGFPEGLKFGNGLNNTVNRIRSINGQINFGKSIEGGASISIRFPLETL